MVIKSYNPQTNNNINIVLIYEMDLGMPNAGPVYHSPSDTWTFWVSNVIAVVMIGITLTGTVYVF